MTDFSPPRRFGSEWQLVPKPEVSIIVAFMAGHYESKLLPLVKGEDYRVRKIGSISIPASFLFTKQEDALWAYLRL